MKKLLLIACLPGFMCAEPLTRGDKAKIAGWSGLSGAYALLSAACLAQASLDYGALYTKDTLAGVEDRPTGELLWKLATVVGGEVGAGLGFAYCAAEAAKKAKAVHDARCGDAFEIEANDSDEDERSVHIAKSAVWGWISVSMARCAYAGTEFIRHRRAHGSMRSEDKKQMALMAIALPALLYSSVKAGAYSVQNARKAARKA